MNTVLRFCTMAIVSTKAGMNTEDAKNRPTSMSIMAVMRLTGFLRALTAFDREFGNKCRSMNPVGIETTYAMAAPKMSGMIAVKTIPINPTIASQLRTMMSASITKPP